MKLLPLPFRAVVISGSEELLCSLYIALKINDTNQPTEIVVFLLALKLQRAQTIAIMNRSACADYW